MKVLGRAFNKKEKALIVFFIIVLLGLCYYRFVHVPITEAIEAAQNEQLNLQDEEAVAKAQAKKLKKMADEVAELKAQGVKSTQLSYNGHKEEVAFLNEVLEDTMNYSLSFSAVKRSSDQVRRNFSLKFTAENYAKAKEIIKALNDSPYRILIGDMSFSKKSSTRYNSVLESAGTYRATVDYEVTVSLSGTFYETTVGGTADSGLPS